MLKTLTTLAEQYGSDKLYSHSYIPVYAELFEGRTVRRLLEIGIGYRDLMAPFTPKFVPGSSLRMWEAYFPEAEIFACDIRPETLLNEGRIHSMVCDQSSVQSLTDLASAFGTDFDIVIDDGSHVTEHQYITARFFLPTMKPGSLYVIEDVREPHVLWQALAPYATRKRGQSIDVEHFDKRPDDCLVVCQL